MHAKSVSNIAKMTEKSNLPLAGCQIDECQANVEGVSSNWGEGWCQINGTSRRLAAGEQDGAYLEFPPNEDERRPVPISHPRPSPTTRPRMWHAA